MDALKKDILEELNSVRMNKKHVYDTILKIIDLLPQTGPVSEDNYSQLWSEKCAAAAKPTEPTEPTEPAKPVTKSKKKKVSIKV